VTIAPDAVAAPTCGCGCRRPLPAPPVAGGRAPVYASRACQQRAYRQRQAAAHATPAPVADPPSVAGLIRDIRDLAGRLDAGETIPADLPGAIRAGTRDLLARTTTTAPDGPGLRLVPAPITHQLEETAAPSRDDRPRPVAGDEPTPTRRRGYRPVVIRNTDTGSDHELSEETSAAVRAAHALRAGSDAALAVRRAPAGSSVAYEVLLDGVRLGWVDRAPYGARGWYAVNLGLSRGRVAHRTRQDAAIDVLADLDNLASRARPASLRP
jgi:hypothetical protein